MAATDDRTVSLVVPVRNEATHVDACIRAIRAQDYPSDRLEIIVVDGDSSDGTRSVVNSHAAQDRRVTLLHNPRRAMPYGLNIGIRAATGTYVGVVSGHSVLPPDYVAKAVAALEGAGAWGVGGQIVRRASTPMQHAIAIATSSRIGVGDSIHNYATRSGWVETAFPGFWRRDVFERVGLFDPRMVVNEDNELSYRIRKAGGRIWYEASLEVAYVPRASLTGLFHQYRRYALGKMRVLRKHRGGLRWRHLVPAGWILFVIVGGGAALAIPAWASIWAAGLALYLVVIALSSIRLSRRGAPWWLIAAALITLHTAYGVGTWQGVLSWYATPPAR